MLRERNAHLRRHQVMRFLARHRTPIIAVGLVVLVAGFLAFRPDKLFVDDRVDESLAEAFAASADVAEPTPTTTVAPEPPPTTTTLAGSAAPTTTTTAAPEPAGPLSVASGGFYGIDHAAAGTATVYEQNGRYVLRFEDDTNIQNGPDLYVWLLAQDDYAGGDPGEYIDLGKIKGNVGGQNYELPAEYDPEVHETVLIWCLRFSAPFAAAPLA
jgi:hypothetical protein